MGKKSKSRKTNRRPAASGVRAHHQDTMQKSNADTFASTNGVKLDRPTGSLASSFGTFMSFFFGARHTEGTYRKPRGVDVDELFVLKIQANSEFCPILVYDETRTCEFTIGPGTSGFEEVLTETQKEMAWGGRKTFMKASFDESGTCTIYPASAGVQSNYYW